MKKKSIPENQKQNETNGPVYLVGKITIQWGTIPGDFKLQSFNSISLVEYNLDKKKCKRY